MDTSSEMDSHKVPLEDLPKEEIIKKYMTLRGILQKAKLSQGSLAEENNNLKEKLISYEKSAKSTEEIIETLTGQKLNLVTEIDGYKVKIKHLEEELKGLQEKSNKLVQLDTENESYKRQVDRLIKENEELINSLDDYEKQIIDLKVLSTQQEQHILDLNKVQDVDKLHENLEGQLAELNAKNEALTKSNQELTEQVLDNTTIIRSLKSLIEEKDKAIESYASQTDDLNTELHKNKALAEKLKKDVITTTSKLTHSQIISSGVASDLENTNEKLKDKVKTYHQKIVKFAGDVKVLKQSKGELLECVRFYIGQVNMWRDQLEELHKTLASEMVKSNKENAVLLQVINEQKEKYSMLETEYNNFRTNNEKLSEEHDLKLSQEIDNIRKEKELLQVQAQKANQNLNHFEENLNGATEKIKQLQETCEEKEKHISELLALNCDFESKNSTLNTKVTDLETELNTHIATTQSLQENLSKYQEVNKDLESRLENTIQEMEALKRTADKTDQTSQTEENLQEQINSLKAENAELLKEMNDMNQVLKDRGEAISKQQEYCEELMKKLKNHEQKTSNYFDMLQEKDTLISELEFKANLVDNDSRAVNETDLQKVVNEKEEELAQLRTELASLKEKYYNQDLYAENESMSTSTISRAEDLIRLKDFETSWEERYSKLRSLAVKLKAKVRELTTDLNREQAEKNDCQQKLANALKTTQLLQNQCDKLQDDLENQKKLTKECTNQLDAAARNISKTKMELAENDKTISDLRRDVEVLNSEKLATENWKKQVGVKVQNLKKELEVQTLVKKDFESQIANLTAQLEAKNKALKVEIQKHCQSKGLLQESNNECKKQSLLNLEMQDYERSLKELNHKLEKKQEIINKLKDQIGSHSSELNLLKEEKRLLEETLHSGEMDLNKAKSELAIYKNTLSDLENKLMQKDEIIHTINCNLESVRAENEELSTQLSKIVADQQKSTEELKSEREYLRSANLGLEEQLRETRHLLHTKESQLKQISAEYETYKIRAQSVLRQNQVRDVGMEEKLSEQAASLDARVKVLMGELEENKRATEHYKKEYESIAKINEELKEKCESYVIRFEEQQKQFDDLSVKHHQTISEHNEAVRNLKVKSETLMQCFRQQLTEQEARHNKEIIELQSKLDSNASVIEPSAFMIPPPIREQGEGSENTDTDSIPPQLTPLERLLSTDSDQEFGFMRKQLVENEAKVAHLTALLADTEQDLAKHVQMNNLLKEEIRRQQRSVEREQHAENLEYLKNVVFKFATLGNGDERSRLVPVLNTILKFSPEETSKLNAVARGEALNKTWSSYLPPLWSSPNKP